MSSETYFTYKGTPFAEGEHSVETLSFVENEFQLLDDDTVVVTYPKSGTFWMQEILGLIRNDGDPSRVQNLGVLERPPWIEHECFLKRALALPPPRLLSSHLPFHVFPKSFLHSKAKVIYTMRNPRDVLVSFYYFAKGCKAFKNLGTLADFMEEFLSGNVLYGSWFDHVKSWIGVKERPNVFFVTYEELQQLDSVVENASFQKMKENKMLQPSQLPERFFKPMKGIMFRKGICGDWKNHLTVAQSEHFDHVYREKMQGVGLTFPWD
ncbi:sulfotransferase 2B1-like [Varanus komodoensis]|uniref:sulfotransferase 2B1-like n=1 Tax=Varanus komodoensis TaxID=61221 RepID=UPI001CF7C8B8|nr:sulfotransferase 2B1-like [Varanus komodoensis]